MKKQKLCLPKKHYKNELIESRFGITKSFFSPFSPLGTERMTNKVIFQNVKSGNTYYKRHPKVSMVNNDIQLFQGEIKTNNL